MSKNTQFGLRNEKMVQVEQKMVQISLKTGFDKLAKNDAGKGRRFEINMVEAGMKMVQVGLRNKTLAEDDRDKACVINENGIGKASVINDGRNSCTILENDGTKTCVMFLNLNTINGQV